MLRILSAAVAGLALFTALAKAEEAPSAPALTSDNFEEKVGASPHFVMFYAPWCGHCKRLAPAWEELAGEKNVEGGHVTIAKVDCTKEVAVCSEQDVTGYPTLKFFKDSADKDSAEKYRGQRDKKSLKSFINKKLDLEPEEEEAMESEDAKVENGLYILTAGSFEKEISNGHAFVKFYAPWCGHCQSLAPTWDELAKEFEKSDTVKIAKIDCTQHQSVCQENEVKGYPTLAYFKDGKKAETYKGARQLKDLKDFVETESGIAGKAKEEDKAEEPSNVIKLDKENFEDKTAKGVWFVKFFAPWCGHCKRLAPTWAELATKYLDNEDISIAHVDCTADDNKNRALCDSKGVTGFPTLLVFKDGNRMGEYNDKRDMDALVAYVEKIKTKEPEASKENKDEL